MEPHPSTTWPRPMTVVDPALWPVVSALFDDALALPAPARDAWLEALHAA